MMIERNTKWFIAGWICAASLLGCESAVEDNAGGPADAYDACFTCGAERADRFSIPEPSYLSAAVLDVANSLSERALDDAVELDRRAAKSIVDARESGKLKNLAELDDVPWVGPHALRALADYAYANGHVGTCGDAHLQPSMEACDDGNSRSGDGCSNTCQPDSTVSVHGITEASPTASAILDVVNHASLEVLDEDIQLDTRAARGIVETRPFASLTELDRVPWVGASAFTALQDYATGATSCTHGRFESLVDSINATRFGGNFARSIRDDVALVDILDQRMWPGEATRVACFGVDANALPSWIPTSRPENGERLYSLTESFAISAIRAGADVNASPGLEELECRTEGMSFTGCRFEFEPNAFSGITWSFIESSDGSMRYFFESAWME